MNIQLKVQGYLLQISRVGCLCLRIALFCLVLCAVNSGCLASLNSELYLLYPVRPGPRFLPPCAWVLSCSVSGIFQARILKWVALQGIFQTQESNLHLLCLLHWQAGFLPLCHMGNSSYPHMWPKTGFYVISWNSGSMHLICFPSLRDHVLSAYFPIAENCCIYLVWYFFSWLKYRVFVGSGHWK